MTTLGSDLHLDPPAINQQEKQKEMIQLPDQLEEPVEEASDVIADGIITDEMIQEEEKAAQEASKEREKRLAEYVMLLT